jgi:hypothetical protein
MAYEFTYAVSYTLTFVSARPCVIHVRRGTNRIVDIVLHTPEAVRYSKASPHVNDFRQREDRNLIAELATHSLVQQLQSS